MNHSNSNAFRGHYSNSSLDSLNHQATSPYPPAFNGNRNVTQSGIGRNAPLEERFLHWFNHPFESIYKKGDNPWLTSKFPLSNPREIFKLWRCGSTRGARSPKQVIGLRFGSETNYGLIDVDRESPYSSEEGIKRIKHALEEIGINNTILVQSSWSEGYHLYYFLPEKVKSFQLATAVSIALIEAGLKIKDGILEIFPNQKSWQKDRFTSYKGHRLPLQPDSGSFILDQDFAPYSEDLGHFLNLADDCAESVDLEILEEALETAKERFKQLNKVVPLKRRTRGGLSEVAAAWQSNLEKIISTGWTGCSQTNDLLKELVTYGIVFKGLSGQELEDYVLTTAIAAPGYSQFCRHQRDIKKRVHDRCYYTERNGYYTPYCGWPERMGGKGDKTSQGQNKGLTNEERRRECMIRIIECMEDLIIGDRLPKKVGERRKLISMLCHCSERTLAKPEYLPLWHPMHYKPLIERVSEDNKILDHTPLLRVVPYPPINSEEKKLNSSSTELIESLKGEEEEGVLSPATDSQREMAIFLILQGLEGCEVGENKREDVLLDPEILSTQGFDEHRGDFGQESLPKRQTCDHRGSNLVPFPKKSSEDNFSSG
ncbi:hypothetical protein VB715_19510 [Crocosphaera sp. UHCC 0190]|uniref:hypothetical protein n=1 Tax=Crocosphaera sp. UHCC 0190 TaxID=3110246 RepID=UPI002B202FEF|nr:hypothetical protein [Crocosphaera sp. UHCC 0190]MEA5511964.1 hypothetical protein [Crocosphaera sp. UHCC 0190]